MRKHVGDRKEKELNRCEDTIGEPLTDTAWNALACLTTGELNAVAYWLENAKRTVVSRTLADERDARWAEVDNG